jgi:hypothetical protein
MAGLRNDDLRYLDFLLTDKIVEQIHMSGVEEELTSMPKEWLIQLFQKEIILGEAMEASDAFVKKIIRLLANPKNEKLWLQLVYLLKRESDVFSLSTWALSTARTVERRINQRVVIYSPTLGQYSDYNNNMVAFVYPELVKALSMFTPASIPSDSLHLLRTYVIFLTYVVAAGNQRAANTRKSSSVISKSEYKSYFKNWNSVFS